MEVRNGSLEMAPYHQGLGWFRSDFIKGGGEGGSDAFFRTVPSM